MALSEITQSHLLGVQLGIDAHELEKIEKNYPRDVDRQKLEAIKYWQRNSEDCSWAALATAVEKMGGHGNLVKRLRDLEDTVPKTEDKTVAKQGNSLLNLHATIIDHFCQKPYN